MSSVNYLSKESLLQSDKPWHEWILKEQGSIQAWQGLFFSKRALIINQSISLNTDIILGFYSGARGHAFILMKY